MEAILPLTKEELDERIERNFRRLCEPYYQIEQVFSPADYDWPGDKEGRAMLAFSCHVAMTGRRVPCLDQMLAQLDERTNAQGYFGPLAGEPIFEQQLSGHSWYLRGLCAVYRYTQDAACLRRMRQTFEGLYWPLCGRVSGYPITRAASAGGVSGNSDTVVDGWLLSTDIGCAFMSIDGLSDYYDITGDERALTLLDEMIRVFDGIDKLALQAQTHCTLSAARGMMRLYHRTGNADYRAAATRIWRLYIGSGMTYTYQNFNWWGKGDTWTEPCAIVDSLMLALALADAGDEEALTVARRIWHNGLASAQRPNGGAGTDNTVSATCHTLQQQMPEAPFCCTMRLAEGLLCALGNRERLGARLTGRLERDQTGVWHDGDILYARILPGDGVDAVALPEAAQARRAGEYRLTPLVKYYRLDETTAAALRQQVVLE